MKVYTEEKSLKDKVKFEERKITEISKKKKQTDTDKKNLQKHKDNIKKHEKRLMELAKEQETMRIYTPDKDKTPDISNIVSPMPGSDRQLTVKGKEIKDCMTEDGWTYAVGSQRKIGKHQVESIMRAKRNPFFKSVKPLKCPDDFTVGQDETIVKQWLVWQHEATVMFVIPEQDKVITFDTSASLGGKTIKALGTQVRNLSDLVGNEMVFVGFMQEK
jgi:hypothetical protein